MFFVLLCQASSLWYISVFNIVNIFSKVSWDLYSVLILYYMIFTNSIFIFISEIVSSIISLPQSSVLLFIFKFSQNSILTISLLDAFHLVFLLKVEITNVINTFQDLNILIFCILLYAGLPPKFCLVWNYFTCLITFAWCFILTAKALLWFFSFITTMDFTDSATQSKFVCLNILLLFCDHHS